MAKKQIAKEIAKHMNMINNEVNIERQTKVLMNNMSKNELEAALRGFNK